MNEYTGNAPPPARASEAGSASAAGVSSPPPERGRLLGSAAILARGIDHRAELASIELGEARDHAFGISILFISGIVAGLLVGVALNFLIAAIWWDTAHRILAISLTLLAQLLIAAFALVAARRRLRLWHPLAATFDQLKKDSVCLRDFLAPPRS